MQISSSLLYQTPNFVLQHEFCKLSKRLLTGPCTDDRRELVERQSFNICSLVEERSPVLHNCTNWPRTYLNHVSRGKPLKLFEPDNPEAPFISAVNKYATENMASLKLSYRTPYVQAIKADLEMRHSLDTYLSSAGFFIFLSSISALRPFAGRREAYSDS